MTSPAVTAAAASIASADQATSKQSLADALGTVSTALNSPNIDATQIGAVTPSTGAFTTLSASGTVSGAGFVTFAASFVSANNTALTGTPTAPTAALGTNTTQIATTAFAYANFLPFTFQSGGTIDYNTLATTPALRQYGGPITTANGPTGGTGDKGTLLLTASANGAWGSQLYIDDTGPGQLPGLFYRQENGTGAWSTGSVWWRILTSAGGLFDNATIGSVTPGSGAFTTLSVSGTTNLTNGTINLGPTTINYIQTTGNLNNPGLQIVGTGTNGGFVIQSQQKGSVNLKSANGFMAQFFDGGGGTTLGNTFNFTANVAGTACNLTSSDTTAGVAVTTPFAFSTKVGFNNASPSGKITITGSRGSATATVLESLLQAMQTFGLITDSTTA